MNKIKLLLIILLFTTFGNVSFSEEKVECKDVKKYFKKMACFSKAAKKKIGSKITSSKRTLDKIAAAVFFLNGSSIILYFLILFFCKYLWTNFK